MFTSSTAIRRGFAASALALVAGVATWACSDAKSDSVTSKQQLQTPDWSAGTAYQVGDLVAFEGSIFRCVQAHTAAPGWDPVSVPALWESYDPDQTVPTPPPTGPLPAEPTIEDMIFGVDCRTNPENCCPAGAEPNTLTDGPDTLQILSPNECVIAGHGADTLYVSSSGPSALHLGPGDDTAMDGPGDDIIFGGDGRDTINGHGGTNFFFAGAGDDTIMAANGDNTVVPGPGRDTVALGTGNDTVYIFNECEVEGGETISAGTGDDTLIIPRPLEEMAALGLSVSGFETVIVRPLTCYSDCSAPTNNAASLSVTPDACDGASCCPSQEEQEDEGKPHACRSASSADELIVGPAGSLGVQEMIFGLTGNDQMVDSRGAMLVAGDGHDVLCPMATDIGFADGGSGDDEITSRSEDALIVPGAGRDEVTVVGGNARIVLMAECEAVAGESYTVVDGSATLLSPISREDLEARGVAIDPAITVEIVPGNLCLSECAGAPTCAEDEACVSDGEVAFCELKDHTLTNYSVFEHPGYPELPDGVRQDVEELVDAVQAGEFFGTAPDDLRVAADAIIPVLTEAARKSHPRRRAAEVFTIGALFTVPALDALVEIALDPAPQGTPNHHGGKGWHVANLHAARWLAVAARQEPTFTRHYDNLKRLILEGDRLTSQAAFSAYLQTGDESIRRAELSALLPAERQYLLTLEFR